MAATAQVERPVLLGSEDAARYLGLSVTTILRLRKEGKLRGKWISRGYYFRQAVLDDFAQADERADEYQGTGTGQRQEGVRLLRGPGAGPGNR